ncbi:uncharacterized protein LOC100212090 isoform X1 [Hydra vulgaris]|nr:uncharacterized protein LOC100212090 isoform X2 [Hydra vulgaris]XP_047126248.1 uncharacterized protein LOC100212090 isoform X2 [Hydra vulgaris]
MSLYRHNKPKTTPFSHQTIGVLDQKSNVNLQPLVLTEDYSDREMPRSASESAIAAMISEKEILLPQRQKNSQYAPLTAYLKPNKHRSSLATSETLALYQALDHDRRKSCITMNELKSRLDKKVIQLANSPSHTYRTQLTFEEWLTRKEFNRKKNLVDLNEMQKGKLQLFKLKNSPNKKTYDQWMAEKIEKIKEEKTKLQQNETEKSKNDKKDAEKKYTDWLIKKYEKDTYEQIVVWKKLQNMNNKENDSNQK